MSGIKNLEMLAILAEQGQAKWLVKFRQRAAYAAEKRRLKAAFARKKRPSLPLERRRVEE